MGINDEKLRSLNTLLGTSGGQVDTRFHQWLVANVTGGDVTHSIAKLWKDYLSEQGYTGGSLSAMTYEYLTDRGYSVPSLSGKELAAWEADDYLGAPGIAYLLRQTFTAGNTALANGNTITGPGGGGTVESSGVDDTGTLTVQDLGDGAISIASNKLKLDPLNNATAYLINTVSADISAGMAVNGTVLKHTVNIAEKYASPGVNDLWWYFTDILNSTTVAGANRHAVFAMSEANAAPTRYLIADYNPAGTLKHSLVVAGETWPAATDIDVAIVRGGWTSGVPDAAGDDGVSMFVKLSGSWKLLGALPNVVWTGSQYASWSCYEGSTSTKTDGSCTVDEIKLPSTTVEAVFTPSGYALDTFVEASNTDLQNHTGNTGQTYTKLRGGASDDIIVSAATDVIKLDNWTGPNGVMVTTTTFAESDFFASANIEHGGASGGVYIVARNADANNAWFFGGNRTNHFIYELTAGGFTSRSSAGFVATDSQVHSVRCSGTTLETWMNGVYKLSYTSSVHQTDTGIGVSLDSSTTPTMDNLYALPLTSTTYDTELDAI